MGFNRVTYRPGRGRADILTARSMHSYILILANRRSVLGRAANDPVFRAVASICVVVVGILSAVVLVQTVDGWL